MESDPKFPMDLHPTMKIFFRGAVDKLRGAGVPDVHPEGAPSIQAFTEIIHAILLQENLSDEEQDAMHLKLERTMRPFLLFGGKVPTSGPTQPPTQQIRPVPGKINTTPSSAGPAASSSGENLKKRSADDISERDAANAKAAKSLLDESASECAKSALATLMQNSPHHVQCLAPLISANTIAANELKKVCEQAAEVLCVVPFDDQPFNEDSEIFELDEDTPVNLLRERIRDLSRTMKGLLLCESKAHAAAAHLHRVYWLVHFTQGANYDTYEQIKFRAAYDLAQSAHDPSVIPETDWREQVKSAMARLGQTSGTTGSGGIDLGPICPSITKRRGDDRKSADTHRNNGARGRKAGGGQYRPQAAGPFSARDAGSRAPAYRPPNSARFGRGGRRVTPSRLGLSSEQAPGAATTAPVAAAATT